MKINKGDIFRVGSHIIGGGDSLDKDFVAKVIGNNKIRAVLTDPPYGVAYVENKKGFAKLGVKDEKIIIGDHIQSEDEYEEFTRKYEDEFFFKEENSSLIKPDTIIDDYKKHINKAGFFS